MFGNAAAGRFIDLANGINAPGTATRFAPFYKWRNLLHGDRRSRQRVIFKGPLLLRSINLQKIVHAVRLRRLPLRNGRDQRQTNRRSQEQKKGLGARPPF